MKLIIYILSCTLCLIIFLLSFACIYDIIHAILLLKLGTVNIILLMIMLLLYIK